MAKCACAYPEAKAPCPSEATSDDGLCDHCRSAHSRMHYRAP